MRTKGPTFDFQGTTPASFAPAPEARSSADTIPCTASAPQTTSKIWSCPCWADRRRKSSASAHHSPLPSSRGKVAPCSSRLTSPRRAGRRVRAHAQEERLPELVVVWGDATGPHSLEPGLSCLRGKRIPSSGMPLSRPWAAVPATPPARKVGGCPDYVDQLWTSSTVRIPRRDNRSSILGEKEPRKATEKEQTWRGPGVTLKSTRRCVGVVIGRN